MIQVVVTIFILSMGITAGAKILINAMNVNLHNKNRLIAINLAQEGLEVIRNMRDTNYLTYSSLQRQCWNFWDDTTHDGVVDSGDDICSDNGSGQNDSPWGRAAGTRQVYLVNFDPTNFRWILLKPDTVASKISSTQVTTKLYRTADGLYTHDPDTPTATPFSREITIQYLDQAGFDETNDETGEHPTDNLKDNRILVRSTVEWQQQGSTRHVTLSTILTDFYNRQGWSE